jgi:hypothetical protein
MDGSQLHAGSRLFLQGCAADMAVDRRRRSGVPKRIGSVHGEEFALILVPSFAPAER